LKVFGVVIAGTGAFAHTHAGALGRHERLRLAGFVGATAESAREIASQYGVGAFESLAQVLDDPAVDAVIVATPHASHSEIGVAVLDAGKSVLIEKPLAIDLAQCDELIAAEGRSSGYGMVGHLMGGAPAHQQARALIAAGAIGRVVGAESRRIIAWNADERRAWQKSAAEGGGMWLIQGVHVVDQLSFLLGRRATSAVGTVETRFHPEQDADDFGTALVRFGDIEATIQIAGTRGHAAAQVYTDVVGTEGLLRVSHRGSLQIDDGDGWSDRLQPIAGDHWTTTLDNELTAFAELLATGRGAMDFAYGRYVLGVIDAVRRSAVSRSWEALR
jgi:predicted dehydrogenase